MPESDAETECRNCGLEISQGRYCPACGQRDIDFKRDWKGLVAEYASSMFNFDGKVPRGILDLMFRPGKMTVDFLAGKRASQIPPVRLYLFASLVFFIWVSATEDFEMDDIQPEQLEQMEFDETLPGGPDLAKSIAEKFQNTASIEAEFLVWLPRMFLLGVPALALASRLVFWRRDLVYLEHMIISMHLQTFLLLWVLFLAFLEYLAAKLWPWGATHIVERLDLWILLYPVFAARRIFSLSWIKAVFAAITLEVVFLMMVFVGVSIVAVMAIWLA